MAGKGKHSRRSMRSNKNYIPFEMFAANARWKKWKKDQMKIVQEGGTV